MSRKLSLKNTRATLDSFGPSIKMFTKDNVVTGKYEKFDSSTNSNSYTIGIRNKTIDNDSHRNKGIMAELVMLAIYIYFLKIPCSTNNL